MSDENVEHVGVPSRLQPFVEKWAHAREAERMAARRNSSPQERVEFYQALLAEFDHLVERIGGRKPEDLSEEERTVLYLLLAGVEVSQMVEVFGAAGMGPEVFPEERFEALM